MLKFIQVNLEPIESMLYYWTSVTEREKVTESFFFDVADMDAMKFAFTEEFHKESVRKVLSAIQNRELLSVATKAEKRFWSNNMWMMEDLSLGLAMAQPIKVLNLSDLVDKVNENPNFPYEKVTVYFAPLHLDDYYINEDKLIINFFKIATNDGKTTIAGEDIYQFILDKLNMMK